jgi:hypothetical protein
MHLGYASKALEITRVDNGVLDVRELDVAVERVPNFSLEPNRVGANALLNPGVHQDPSSVAL